MEVQVSGMAASKDDIDWEPSFMRLSPSKINTYMKCPREFYYKYIAKLPEKKTIHLFRGSVGTQDSRDVYSRYQFKNMTAWEKGAPKYVDSERVRERLGRKDSQVTSGSGKYTPRPRWMPCIPRDPRHTTEFREYCQQETDRDGEVEDIQEQVSGMELSGS